MPKKTEKPSKIAPRCILCQRGLGKVETPRGLICYACAAAKGVLKQ